LTNTTVCQVNFTAYQANTNISSQYATSPVTRRRSIVVDTISIVVNSIIVRQGLEAISIDAFHGNSKATTTYDITTNSHSTIYGQTDLHVTLSTRQPRRTSSLGKKTLCCKATIPIEASNHLLHSVLHSSLESKRFETQTDCIGTKHK